MKLLSLVMSITIYAFSFCIFILFGAFLLFFSLVSKKLLFKYIPLFCRLLLLSLGVHVRCNNGFPKDGNYVVMCNHSSFIDVFIFPCFINGFFTAISADENFKIPFFGSMLRSISAIPINRSNSESAVQSIKSAEKFMKKSGYSVVILPEGTRTLDGELKKFKKGGFHMAINTNLAIIPMVSIGAFNYKPKNRFSLRPGIVDINIGEPISTNNISVNDLIDKTYEEMSKLIKEVE